MTLLYKVLKNMLVKQKIITVTKLVDNLSKYIFSRAIFPFLTNEH